MVQAYQHPVSRGGQTSLFCLHIDYDDITRRSDTNYYGNLKMSKVPKANVSNIPEIITFFHIAGRRECLLLRPSEYLWKGRQMKEYCEGS